MGMNGEPKFAVGDRVVSFRGEYATVVAVRDSQHPGKSNRVYVQFDADMQPCTIEYYETVFSLAQLDMDATDCHILDLEAQDSRESGVELLDDPSYWYNAHDPFGNTL